jgi:hypothetical protein
LLSPPTVTVCPSEAFTSIPCCTHTEKVYTVPSSPVYSAMAAVSLPALTGGEKYAPLLSSVVNAARNQFVSRLKPSAVVPGEASSAL